LYGHGLSSKPHKFVFKKPCTAGGFVGCDAGSTNNAIPDAHRINGVKLTDGDLYSGFGSIGEPEDEQFSHWFEKMKTGAEATAKTFCKSKDCCCSKVYIYGELAGSSIHPDNWAMPGGWTKTVDCSTVGP